MCWNLRTLLLNVGSFVYMDLKTLKFDLETSHEGSEILHPRTSLPFLVDFFQCLRNATHFTLWSLYFS